MRLQISKLANPVLKNYGAGIFATGFIGWTLIIFALFVFPFWITATYLATSFIVTILECVLIGRNKKENEALIFRRGK